MIDEAMAYIDANFDISGEAGRLISNILKYAERMWDESDRYLFLCEMLEGTIGLSDREIKHFLV